MTLPGLSSLGKSTCGQWPYSCKRGHWHCTFPPSLDMSKASALPASNSCFQRNPDLRCDRRAPLRSGRAGAPAGAPMCRRKAPLKMEVGLCRPGLTSSEPEDVLEPARPGRAARARTHIHLCGEATIIARGAARISAPRSASAHPGCRQ